MDFGLNKNSPPIRDVANKSITTLRLQQAKLDQANYRLRERDRILFKACTDAKTKNNQDKASMCANELVEVRRLAKFLSDMHLSIERVVLRLETIRELSDIVVDLRPALKLLQNVSSDLGQIMPNVSSELANVTDAIQDTLRATKIRSDETLIPVGQKTDGGEEILKEVSSFIQQRIVQDLPEPPVFAPAQSVKTPQAPIKELVALSATTSEMFGAKEVKDSGFDVSKTLISYKKSEVKEITLEIKQPISKQPTIDEVLFDYLRKCNGGEIDLSKCSNDLKTSTKEIERALENLGTQGKIKLELKSPE